jgi:hypothetical protein
MNRAGVLTVPVFAASARPGHEFTGWESMPSQLYRQTGRETRYSEIAARVGA